MNNVLRIVLLIISTLLLLLIAPPSPPKAWKPLLVGLDSIQKNADLQFTLK